MAKDPIKKQLTELIISEQIQVTIQLQENRYKNIVVDLRQKKRQKEEYSKTILSFLPKNWKIKRIPLLLNSSLKKYIFLGTKHRLKKVPISTDVLLFKKHFKYFYKMSTDEIEPINVQNWQLKMAKEFSPNYIRIVQGMLSIAFDRAIVLGLDEKKSLTNDR